MAISLMACARVKNAGDIGSHMSISCVCNCVNAVFRSGKILKTILCNFGWPRKYNGLGSMTTESPRFQLTYLNGPMPTGSPLYSAVLIFGTLESKCLGRTHGFAPAEEKNVTANGAYFSFSRSRTVYGSMTSTVLISDQPSRLSSFVAGFKMVSIVKATSSAVNGS